ncbi:hypothetical protein CEXT_98871 [Caerostris extrusa]|uniref:Uncharacterized protein n=1 Tax=Caerostris extrusa TaxID=172846 RepID=A0AAV4QGN7_CAEEX|nr:hypothetical protein CEXT_98871 [Caerostris extrusa]
MERKAQDEEVDLESDARLDEYVVIPRPEPFVQSQLHSSQSKEKQVLKELSLRKRLKEKLSAKETSKERKKI